MLTSRHHRRRRRTHTRLTALAATVALLATGGALGAATAHGDPATTAATTTATATAEDGARIVGQKWLDERTVDLTVRSPAVGADVPVRVLLPASYAAAPTRERPVLYLLQGAHDDYTSWSRETDVEDFLAGQDVITVMPSSGPTGIPTDWWNLGRRSPDYETFQVDEVAQLLRGAFHAGPRRAVAGVSTGGYGALAFAARHPGTFGAAASYSGILDTTALGMVTVVNAIVARERQLPSTLWGNPLLHRTNWTAHNPYALASRLKDTRLYVAQGSGIPSDDFGNLEGAVLEGTLWGQAKKFTARLDALGVPAKTHLYGGGSHAWPYWQREFKESWPTLAAGLGLPQN
ncbi:MULTISPECIES: alpha/beta hydrolase family protein [unclassified Streptomyces]|uniref:alpha/beta hydrolase n=1 Tax=unclassified Streptomyces TaxID=2593676 RepID=UPI00278C2495|nr:MULTISPECIES: alpha/beta hydrolase family protein [unclassified Streptomyces]